MNGVKRLILASESPRRKELLKQMGAVFEAITSNYDERLDDERSVDEVVCELALGKAEAVAKQYPDAFVIGSDTVVVLDGRQLGKQSDEDAARLLLRELSGRTTEVITAVAVVCPARNVREVRKERAAVTFHPYGDGAIENYLKSDDWRDKAAAIAVQSPDTPPIQSIEGSYDTILGFATKPLAEMLRPHGFTLEPVTLRPPYVAAKQP